MWIDLFPRIALSIVQALTPQSHTSRIESKVSKSCIEADVIDIDCKSLSLIKVTLLSQKIWLIAIMAFFRS